MKHSQRIVKYQAAVLVGSWFVGALGHAETEVKQGAKRYPVTLSAEATIASEIGPIKVKAGEVQIAWIDAGNGERPTDAELIAKGYIIHGIFAAARVVGAVTLPADTEFRFRDPLVANDPKDIYQAFTLSAPQLIAGIPFEKGLISMRQFEAVPGTGDGVHPLKLQPRADQQLNLSGSIAMQFEIQGWQIRKSVPYESFSFTMSANIADAAQNKLQNYHLQTWRVVRQSHAVGGKTISFTEGDILSERNSDSTETRPGPRQHVLDVTTSNTPQLIGDGAFYAKKTIGYDLRDGKVIYFTLGKPISYQGVYAAGDCAQDNGRDEVSLYKNGAIRTLCPEVLLPLTIAGFKVATDFGSNLVYFQQNGKPLSLIVGHDDTNQFKSAQGPVVAKVDEPVFFNANGKPRVALLGLKNDDKRNYYIIGDDLTATLADESFVNTYISPKNEPTFGNAPGRALEAWLSTH